MHDRVAVRVRGIGASAREDAERIFGRFDGRRLSGKAGEPRVAALREIPHHLGAVTFGIDSDVERLDLSRVGRLEAVDNRAVFGQRPRADQLAVGEAK